MAVIEKVYEGGDLIIPRPLLLKLGVRPGEVVLIRPKADLHPVELDVEERPHLLEALDELYGAWTEEDEIEFNRARKEMWAGWRLSSLL
jgi:bifunctional DNA-binding transcriptional regulator/antitoxin component of YhaV-PrlF toxin-antitoxin module